MNIWETIKKPIFILAPMDGVTDTVFRQIVNNIGRPDLFFTEFVAVDAICSSGREKALERLRFDKSEKPIIAQIWGSDPDKFYEAAKIITELGFDGIDINMGCPSGDILKRGACSALIKNPELAVKIIESTIKGAQSANRQIPVSVKTRIGFSSIDTENWVRTLLSTDIAALTLHLRTVKELSKVPAHWDEIQKAIKIKEELKSKALIIGNGDIKSLSQASEMVQKYKIDGVMVGRGIFENVWLFNKKVDISKVSPKQKIELLLDHLNLYKKIEGEGKRFELMKKFVKCYVNNFPGATDVRENLMSSKTLEELINRTKTLNI